MFMCRGLSAAYALQKYGLKVVVLEATDRVGGRVRTVFPAQHHQSRDVWADVGAGFVGPTQSHVMRTCEELGLTVYPCSDELDSIHYTRGKRYLFGDVLPKLYWHNLIAMWDMVVLVRQMEKMSWEVPVEKPWEAPKALDWDKLTVKQFLDKHCWTNYCKEYLMSLSSMDTTANPAHMSLLFYLWYMRQANGPQQLWGWGDGADGMKVLGGSQQITDKLAERLKGPVLLNHPVVKIQHNPDGVMAQTLAGTQFKAKYMIIATPPVTQMKINFQPAVSWKRNSLLQRSPMGLVMKCIVFYKQPFWKHNGFNGFVACSDGVELVDMVFEDHKPGTEVYGLACFVFHEHMIKLSQMSDEMKKVSVCQCLAKFFNSEECLKPIEFVYTTWPSEPFICGGYSCYYPPGALTMFGPALRAPIGSRVFLAGTETATHWTGYMSGAIDAGQRAAREVLHVAGHIPKSEVWVQEPPLRYKPAWHEDKIPSIGTVVRTYVKIMLAVLFCLILCYLITPCYFA